MSDLTQQLRDAVRAALEQQTPLAIVGHGSKRVMFGDPPAGDLLNLSEHQGIVSYQPEEFVLTARAGTPLREIQQTLQRNNQQLAFDPPLFLGEGTLGGAVASGCAGPNRPWSGGARDAILGVKLLNGFGDVLNFGGQVIKNVAGYDLSRLQAGAFGTLGVLLEVSVRLRPIAQTERSFSTSLDVADALSRMRQWMREPLPLSGLAYCEGKLHWRLAGNPAAVQSAAQQLESRAVSEDDGGLWTALRDQRHAFFTTPVTDRRALWSFNLPPAQPQSDTGDWLIEWGGARRWATGDWNKTTVRELAARLAAEYHQYGTAPVLRRGSPLASRLKQAFDPQGIFNVKWLPIHADATE